MILLSNIIPYEPSNWYKLMNIKKYKDRFASAYVKIVLRVTSAYKNVSSMTITVVAGALKTDLLVN